MAEYIISDMQIQRLYNILEDVKLKNALPGLDILRNGLRVYEPLTIKTEEMPEVKNP